MYSTTPSDPSIFKTWSTPVYCSTTPSDSVYLTPGQLKCTVVQHLVIQVNLTPGQL